MFKSNLFVFFFGYFVFFRVGWAIGVGFGLDFLRCTGRPQETNGFLWDKEWLPMGQRTQANSLCYKE